MLAGFYSDRLSFAFPAAFMREARIRIAAEWQPEDLVAVGALLAEGRLALDGLITHSGHPADVNDVYRTAFTDPACLKMVLDWRSLNLSSVTHRNATTHGVARDWRVSA